MHFTSYPLPPILFPLLASFAGIGFAYYGISLSIVYALWCFIFLYLIFKKYSHIFFENYLMIACVSLLSFIISGLIFEIKLYSLAILERNLIDKTITIEGTILDSWTQASGNYNQILLVKTTLPPYDTSGIIKLYCKTPLACSPGMKIFCPGVRSNFSIHPNNNNRADNLARGRSDILGTFFALHNNCKIFTQDYSFIARFSFWVKKKRRKIIENISNKLSPYTFSLYKMLFLGSPDQYSTSGKIISNQFLLCGTTQCLARSGLHVTIILVLWIYFLQLIPCNFALKRILILIALAGYALFSWTSISFLRAFLYCTAKELYALCAIPFLATHTLGLACFLLIIYNPFYIFFLDFQLSFGITSVLLLINDIQRRENIVR